MRWLVCCMLLTRIAAAEPHAMTAYELAGPYKTLAEACRAATPCGFTQIEEATQQMFSPPKRPDCSQLADGPRSGDIRIAPVGCAVPKHVRTSHVRYHAFIKRKDGWWRSDPLFNLEYSEKYCSVAIAAKWQTRGALRVARVTTARDCPACNKQGIETETHELLIAIDPAGDKPVTFEPLLVAERMAIEPDPDTPAEQVCKRESYKAVLQERWTDDTVELTGPARWRPMRYVDSMLDIGIADATVFVTSSAGQYRFAR